MFDPTAVVPIADALQDEAERLFAGDPPVFDPEPAPAALEALRATLPVFDDSIEPEERLDVLRAVAVHQARAAWRTAGDASSPLGSRVLARPLWVGRPTILPSAWPARNTGGLEIRWLVWHTPDASHDQLWWALSVEVYLRQSGRWRFWTGQVRGIPHDVIARVRAGTYRPPAPPPPPGSPAEVREILEDVAARTSVDLGALTPATDAAIAAAEARLGVALPPELLAFYRITNGWPADDVGCRAVSAVEEIGPFPQVQKLTADAIGLFGPDGVARDDLAPLARGISITPDNDTELWVLVPSDDGPWSAHAYAVDSGWLEDAGTLADLLDRLAD